MQVTMLEIAYYKSNNKMQVLLKIVLLLAGK